VIGASHLIGWNQILRTWNSKTLASYVSVVGTRCKPVVCVDQTPSNLDLFLVGVWLFLKISYFILALGGRRSVIQSVSLSISLCVYQMLRLCHLFHSS
jgi:hypothetical protein